MRKQELLKHLEAKKKLIEETLLTTTWNKENITCMYDLGNMINEIDITIKNIKLIEFESKVDALVEYYETLEEMKEFKKNKKERNDKNEKRN